jgi:serine/threonine protein kinase
VLVIITELFVTSSFRFIMQLFHVLENPQLFEIDADSSIIGRVVHEIVSEAEIMATLHHPHVLGILGVGVHPESLLPAFLVFELASDNLGHFMKQRENTRPDEIRRCCSHILKGLVYLHSKEPALIHRDLKPENVLVFPDEEGMPWLKIGDVGLSRHSASRTMSQVGSLHYMAPEMFRGGRYDCKLDVFSFGMMIATIVYNSCSGGTPDGCGILDKDHVIATAKLWFHDSVAFDLVRLIDCCCEVDPERRYSAAQALDVLDTVTQ